MRVWCICVKTTLNQPTNGVCIDADVHVCIETRCLCVTVCWCIDTECVLKDTEVTHLHLGSPPQKVQERERKKPQLEYPFPMGKRE